MTIGMILLIITAILVLLGVGQRILDRLRLNDKLALLFIALTIGLGFVPDIRVSASFSFNIGGAVIPLALCIYLWIRADSARERVRSIIASLATGAAVFAIGFLLPEEPERIPVDPLILYGIAAGLIAYILGRSRRCAFIAGVTGVMISNTVNAIYVWSRGVEQELNLGGAGAFDGIVIAGLLAVLLAELLGELIERIRRGKKPPEKRFDGGDFAKEGRTQ